MTTLTEAEQAAIRRHEKKQAIEREKERRRRIRRAVLKNLARPENQPRQ